MKRQLLFDLENYTSPAPVSFLSLPSDGLAIEKLISMLVVQLAGRRAGMQAGRQTVGLIFNYIQATVRRINVVHQYCYYTEKGTDDFVS